MKDLGLLNYFLGLEINRDITSYFIVSAKYAYDLLASVGLTDCKTASTLIDSQTHIRITSKGCHTISIVS